MTRRKYGRVILLGLGVALLAGAACYALSSYRKRQDIYAWLRAEPTRFSIDLSQPGATRAAFHQTCDVAHNEFLYLQPKNNEQLDRAQLMRRLDGLTGEVAIISVDGREVFHREISSKSIPEISSEELYILADIQSVPRGEYTIQVTIHEGTPALAIVPSVAFARYRLCGIEGLPAAIDGLASLAMGCVGLVLLLIVGIGAARERWKRVRSTREAPTLARHVTGD